MNQSGKPIASPLTDSPWFWLLVFSLFGALAVLAVGGKYGKRQAGIERKFQARERLAATPLEDIGELAARTETIPQAPGTLVPLWPLSIGLGVVALFAAVQLARARIKPQMPNESTIS